MKVPEQKYQELLTKDGSITLVNSKLNESFHSDEGAILETKLHYLEGCQISELFSTQLEPIILEIGFGIGIGFLETLNLLSTYPHVNLTYISLELEEDLVEMFISKHQELIKKVEITTCDQFKIFTLILNQTKLIILQGDARISLLRYNEINPRLKVDAIYQDAFSPKKCPKLWTTQWFSLLKKISKDKTILSTYSSSVTIQKSMIEAGWIVFKGEGLGRKRSSTRAKLFSDGSENLNLTILSNKIAALHDDNIDLFLKDWKI